MFSPAALLTQTLEYTAESGISHYEKFVSAARRYQQQLAVYLDSKYPLDKVNPVNRDKTDPLVERMKVDFGSIPKFEDRTAPLSEAAGPVFRCAAVLAFLTIALFAATFVAFLRYDVR